MAVPYNEFAAKIKAKYPEYKDVDDLTLSQRMVEKFPEYKNQVSFDMGGSGVVQKNQQPVDVSLAPEAGIGMQMNSTPSGTALDPNEANQVIYGQVPGTAKVGDETFAPIGGGYQNTKGKSSVQVMPEPEQVQMQGVNAKAPQLEMQTIVDNPDEQTQQSTGNGFIDSMMNGFGELVNMTGYAIVNQLDESLTDPQKESWAYKNVFSKLHSDLKDYYLNNVKNPRWKAPEKESVGSFIGSMIPYGAMAGLTIAQPELAPVMTSTFFESGYGQGLMQAEGTDLSDDEKAGIGALYGALYTLPIFDKITKVIPKSVLSKAITKSLIDNPESKVLAKDIIENYARKNPSLAKQLLSSTAHSVGTMEVMGIGQLAVNDFLLGQNINAKDYLNTAGESLLSGIAFGVMTGPFAVYAQNAATKARRMNSGEVTIAYDKTNGQPVEIIPTETGMIGLKPNGSKVEVTPDMVENSITMTSTDFYNAIDTFNKTKQVSETIDRDAYSGRLMQALNRLSVDGNVFVPKVNQDGTAQIKRGENTNILPFYSKDAEGNLIGIDKEGKIYKLGNDIPVDEVDAMDVHSSLMAKYDEARKPSEKEQVSVQLEDKTNQETGTIQTLKLKSGETVQTTSGKVVFDESGKFDKNNSSELIYYKDADGNVQILNPNHIESLVEEVPVEVAQEQAVSIIDEQRISAEVDEFYPKEPEYYADENGNELMIYADESGIKAVEIDENGNAINEPYGLSDEQYAEISGKQLPESIKTSENMPVNEGMSPVVSNDMTENAPLTTTEQQNTEEVQKPVIPSDEKGNMIFEQAAPEDTVNFLYDNFDTPEEVNSVVDGRISDLNKQISKIATFKPSGNIQKDIQNKQAQKAQLQQLNEQLQYWNGIKEAIKPETTEQKLSAVDREKEWGDAVSLREHVMRYFTTGGKISWNDKPGTKGLQAEYRGANSERKARFGLIKNDAPTPEQLAHSMWEQLQGTEFGNYDTQEILNEILDVLNTYVSKGQMINAIYEQRSEISKAEQAYLDQLEYEQSLITDVVEKYDDEVFAKVLGLTNFTPEQLSELNLLLQSNGQNEIDTEITAASSEGDNSQGRNDKDNEMQGAGNTSGRITTDTGGTGSGSEGVVGGKQSEIRTTEEIQAETDLSQSEQPLEKVEKTKRFESTKKLSDSEKKEVIKTMKDSYKVMNRPRIEDNDRFIWDGDANDYMQTSDITGRKIRWYIQLPDGRIAHPTELYPNLSANEIKTAETIDDNFMRSADFGYKKGSEILHNIKPDVINQLSKAIESGAEFKKEYDSSDIRERNPIVSLRFPKITDKYNPNGITQDIQAYLKNNGIDVPDLNNFDWERFYNEYKDTPEAVELIEQTLEEIGKPTEPTQKEPWEMTQGRYINDVFGTEKWNNVEQNTFQYKSATKHLKEGQKPDAVQQEWFKEAINKTSDYFKREHKKIVEKALTEGKQVPEEVLKDYPEFKTEVKPEVKNEISALTDEQSVMTKQARKSPTSVRELADMDAQDNNGYLSAGVLATVEQGQTFKVGQRTYTVTKKSKPNNVQYDNGKFKGEYTRTSVTIKDDKGKTYSYELWDDWTQNGKRMLSTIVRKNANRNSDPVAGLSRDIEGDITIDLINEYNQFHNKSDSYKIINKYISDVNRILGTSTNQSTSKPETQEKLPEKKGAFTDNQQNTENKNTESLQKSKQATNNGEQKNSSTELDLVTTSTELASAKAKYDKAKAKYLDLKNKLEKDPAFGMGGQTDIFGNVSGADNLFGNDGQKQAVEAVKAAKKAADDLKPQVDELQAKVDRLKEAVQDKVRGQQEVKFEEKVESPLRKQYNELKEKHPDVLFIFNMGGERYMMFDNDADIASKVLGIETSKSMTFEKAIGFDKNMLDINITKLVKNKNRVGVLDQLVVENTTNKSIIKDIDIQAQQPLSTEQQLNAVASQYGWSIKSSQKGFELVNSKGNTAAILTIDATKGKYSFNYPDGEKILTGNKNVADALTKVIEQNFYGKKTEGSAQKQTPQQTFDTSTNADERLQAATEIIRGLEKTIKVGTTPAEIHKSTNDFMNAYKGIVSNEDYNEAVEYLASGQRLSGVRIGTQVLINVEHNETTTDLIGTYMHETGHKAFDVVFANENFDNVVVDGVEDFIPDVYWQDDNRTKISEAVAHQIEELLNKYTPEQIKNGDVDVSLLDKRIIYPLTKTLNKLSNGKISIVGTWKVNDTGSVPGSSRGIQTDGNIANDGKSEVETNQSDNGISEREQKKRELAERLKNKLGGDKPQFKRKSIIDELIGDNVIIRTYGQAEKISIAEATDDNNIAAPDDLWKEAFEDRKVSNPILNADNIHYAIYDLGKMLKPLQSGKELLHFDRKNGVPSINIANAKQFYSGFEVLIDRYAEQLVRAKQLSTQEAQEVINETLLTVLEAKDYYRRYANGEDVWRTEPEPQFKRFDPELNAIAMELSEMIFEDGDVSFEDYSAQMLEYIGEPIRPLLKPYYEMARVTLEAPNMTSADEVHKYDITNFNHKQYVSNRSGRSQQDSPRTNEVPGNAEVIPSNGGTSGQVGTGKPKGDSRTIGRGRGKGDNDIQPSLFGEQSDNEVSEANKEQSVEKPITGDTDGRGNGIDSTEGHTDINGGTDAAGNKTDTGVSETFKQRVERKLIEQQNAESIPVKSMDIDNIRETLPFLLSEQQDDVLKAETRFFGEAHQNKKGAYGKGMLFTNGTGTGKTYTGLGIAKRFAKQGKGNILIVVPSEAKVLDWAKDGKNLGLEISPLKDTKDAGQGAVVTTYANFRANEALKNRDFDLVMYDESHRLMEEKTGKTSSTTNAHYAHSNVTEWQAFNRIQSVNPAYIQLREMGEARQWKGEPSQKEKDLQEKYNTEIKPVLQERAKKAYENTKVVFLSATPFKAHFNLRYANGSLFDWGNETTYASASRGMSRVDAESQFFLDNFGSAYEWKFHRLQTKQKSNAEAVAMQEVQFAENLIANGAMSGRAIESDKDYSREFPLVTLDNAETFNRALNEIYSDEFKALKDAANNVFHDYNYTTKLFESLKASMSIQRIQDHLDLGRKVVIFHRRKQADVLPPFRSVLEMARLEAQQTAYEVQNMDDGQKKDELVAKIDLIYQHINAFEAKYADLLAWEQTLDYSPAIDQLQRAFGEKVVFINGDTSKKDKPANIQKFNDDNSEVKIIVVQEEAGKEGISLHDTTGKHQRVLMSLSLPISSTTTLQIEGRVYRIGQESNVPFEYPLLGIDQEISDFGQKINKKLSTTENLAMGNQARDLLRSFAEGVLFNSGTEKPNANQGVGGKEYDKKTQNELSEFRKAVLVYQSNQKVRGRRESREGKDYYATPEPVGQKMVEFLGLQAGESAMEPSAGHGAIAMWFPDKVNATVIEPSYSLYTKLNARAGGGNRKMVNDIFENYNIINKYHGIAMNPPFGSGGKTAVDHVEKAFGHLYNNGRIVAIIPQGQADKRLDDFLERTPNAHLIASVKLPSSTFEQAGTSVNTRIVVIDRIDLPSRSELKTQVLRDAVSKGKYDEVYSNLDNEIAKKISEIRSELPQTENIDLSSAKTVDELFNEIEDFTVADRQGVVAETESETTEPVKQNFEQFTQKHGKTGEDMFMVAPTEFFERDVYNKLVAIAKENNGYYSSYSNKVQGVRAGFTFKTQEDADNFTLEANKGISKPEFKRIAPETGFYSTVENALDKLTQEKGTKEQFKAMLLKNGAKQAEMDWMGFDELPEKLTKSDIQNWIDENRIEVQEVEKGTSKTFGREQAIKYLDKGYEIYGIDDSGIEFLIEDSSDIDRADRFTTEEGLAKEETKFSRYTLPGGENYKELLLTMPTNHKSYSLIDVKTNKVLQTSNDYEELVDRRNELGGELVVLENDESKGVTFKSSHFDEPNILAHVRFDEREVNGERVLFIEEFQSDWAQKGKKDGFKTKKEQNKFKKENFFVKQVEENPSFADVISKDNNEIWDTYRIKDFKSFDEILDNFISEKSNANYISDSKERNAVPNMPFRKTDQWLNLAARRMMRYAAENGFDRIAWTTGEQQAERYDLSKHVDKIEITQGTIDGEPIDSYRAKTYKNGSVLEDQDYIQFKDLEGMFGKEIAVKVQNGERVFEGEGLKVGGQGMKAFYNAIVPSAMSKLGKPFGAKVESIDLGFDSTDKNPLKLKGRRYNPPYGQGVMDITRLPGYDYIEKGDYIILDESANPIAFVKEQDAKSEQDAVELWYNVLEGDGEYKRINSGAEVQSIPVTDEMKLSVMEGIPMFKRSQPTVPTFEPGESFADKAKKISEYEVEMNKWQKRNLEKLAAGEANDIEKLNKSVNNVKAKLWEGWADSQKPVKKWQEYLKKQGINIPYNDNYYLRFTATESRIEYRYAEYEKNLVDPFAELLRRFKSIRLKYEVVATYCKLKHADEYTEHIAKQKKVAVTPETDFAGKKAIEQRIGMSAEEYISEFEDMAGSLVPELWEKLKKLSHFSLNEEVRSGRRTVESADAIKKTFNYYVPLKGHADPTAETAWDYSMEHGDYFFSAVKHGKGRMSESADPFSVIISTARSSISASEDNILKQTLLRTAERDTTGSTSVSKTWFIKVGENEDGTTIWEIAPEIRYESTDTQESYNAKVEAEEKRMIALREAGEAYQGKIPKLDTGVWIKPVNTHEHDVTVMRNGETYTIRFNTAPRIPQAINKVNFRYYEGVMGKIFEATGKTTRFLAAAKTMWRPTFIFITNPLRDIHAGLNLAFIDEGAAFTYNVAKYLPVAAYTLGKRATGNIDLNNKYDKMLNNYLLNGGKTGISKILELKQVEANLKDKVNGTIHPLRGVQKLYQTMSEITENQVRLAVYFAAIEKGYSTLKATSMAKEATVNFDRKGNGRNGLREMKSFYAFVNVAYQAIDNIWTKSTQSKESKRRAVTSIMLNMAAGAFLTSIISSLICSLFGKDEDEWVEDFSKLSSFERNANFLVWTPNGVLKYPLGQEFRVYYGLGMDFMMWSKGKQTGAETALNFMKGMSSLLPYNPIESAAHGGLGSAFPDAVAPLTEIYLSNRDWLGSRIYKENQDEDAPGFMKVRTNKKGEPYAPSSLISASEYLNTITGGDNAVKGWISPNPDIINHLFEGYFAGLYQQPLTVVEAVVNKDPKEFIPKALWRGKEDIKTRNTGLNEKYYEFKDEIEETERQIKVYNSSNEQLTQDLKEGTIDKLSYDRMVKKNNDKINKLKTDEFYQGYGKVRVIDNLETELKEVGSKKQPAVERSINSLKENAITGTSTGSYDEKLAEYKSKVKQVSDYKKAVILGGEKNQELEELSNKMYFSKGKVKSINSLIENLQKDMEKNPDKADKNKKIIINLINKLP